MRTNTEIRRLLLELLDTQQYMEKCVFDTLNQSDTLLNLVKIGMMKISELLAGMEATQAELEKTYAGDEGFLSMCSAQEALVGEVGQIFQTIYDHAEEFNDKSHDSEEVVFSQQEIISEMRDLLMGETNSERK